VSVLRVIQKAGQFYVQCWHAGNAERVQALYKFDPIYSVLITESHTLMFVNLNYEC